MSRSVKIVRSRMSARVIASDVYSHNMVIQFCKKHLFNPQVKGGGNFADPQPEDGDLFYIESESIRTTIIMRSWVDVLANYLKIGGIETMLTDNASHKGKKVRYNKHKLKLVEPEDSKYAWQNEASILVAEEDHVVAEVQTGSGKSILAMKGVIRKSLLSIFITKPAYMDKWAGDIADGLGLILDEDFIIVDKVDQLVKLINGGGNKEAKAYLISSFCIDNFIKRWAENPEEYPDPETLMESLKAGITVYDESHELFRMQYWSCIALASGAILDLSATLLPDEPFLKERYAERFPTDCRFNMAYNAFVDVIGLAFSMEDSKIAQRINKQPMYQHHVFESKIRSRKPILNRYFGLLYKILDKWFIKDYKEGQKALVLLATRDMCTDFWAYVKDRHPEFNVQRYIEGDKYDDAKEGDVIISTPGKSGTAVDYIGLVLNIIAVSMNASQRSMQMLGRTRDGCIARWGIHPKAIYPICMNIPKQVAYYNRRRKLLAGRVNSMTTLNTGIVI